ncbi:MAG: magnesium/cobalt transporter CorA [Gallionella sp.]|jgi:magnesium transporter|nr:magnesium/cobalt transporter CorA [Gallionella sp.]MCK9352732.1 magnesium/cobalt transporter CorA [Gallionella sp.]
MLHAFALNDGRLTRIDFEEGGLCSDQPVWIDAVAPTEGEREWLEQTCRLTLPKPEHLRDIEASARFFEHEDSLHLRSDFLSGTESHSRSVAVAFALKGETLISIHAEDLPIFRLLRIRRTAESGRVEDCRDVLVDLYGMDVEFSADALEKVYADLSNVSQHVLDKPLSDKQAGAVLANIAHAEHVNGRIRRNVMDTQRALSFLVRNKRLTTSQIAEVGQIQHDIESLDGHTAFLFDKINFLMDATVGFININQNKIVRLFSVASVALLPPTLIASIYGMNFAVMPELNWKLGYPLALLLMLLSVAIPFWIFHRKGWLK